MNTVNIISNIKTINNDNTEMIDQMVIDAISEGCENDQQLQTIALGLVTEVLETANGTVENVFFIGTLENTLILQSALKHVDNVCGDVFQLVEFNISNFGAVEEAYKNGDAQKRAEEHGTFKNLIINLMDKDVVLDRMCNGNELTEMDIKILERLN